MDLKLKALSSALIATIAGLFIAAIATHNHTSPYAAIGPFAGCYSNGADRLMLSPVGEIVTNGTAAGSYKIVSPVGGKHGFLVEANGLNLKGGNGTPLGATRGTGGFFWPISQRALKITFAPRTEMALRKILPSC